MHHSSQRDKDYCELQCKKEFPSLLEKLFFCDVIHWNARDGRLEAKARFSWIRNNHSKVNNVETNLKEILVYLMDKGVSLIVIHIVEEKGDDV